MLEFKLILFIHLRAVFSRRKMCLCLRFTRAARVHVRFVNVVVVCVCVMLATIAINGRSRMLTGILRWLKNLHLKCFSDFSVNVCFENVY